MDLVDMFEVLGAGAGIVSLLWLWCTQQFGDYNARTIRETLVTLADKVASTETIVHELARVARAGGKTS